MTKSSCIRKIYKLLAKQFKSDMGKINDWLNYPNQLLGGLRPVEMIEAGREKKLLKFIEMQLLFNEAPVTSSAKEASR